MIYYGNPRQVSYGEAIGILLIENYAPFIPGDVANATTYHYPVRFAPVKGVTPDRLFAHDPQLLEELAGAIGELEDAGVRAVTGDCGFLATYQTDLSRLFSVPLFLSSLMQVPFIAGLIGSHRRIGVITANAAALDRTVLDGVGVPREQQEQLAVAGLEDSEAFTGTVFRENGHLDTEAFEEAVTERARRLRLEHPDLGAILLECSLLPPYGQAVREQTGLPVFDYITMIDYVYSAVVKKQYHGLM